MKTFIKLAIISALASNIAVASTSYLGKADEQSVVVSIEPQGSSFKTGDKVKFKGSIKVVGKKNWFEELWDDLFGDNKKGLLENFQKQGIDIVGTFPSSAVDVSSALALQSNGKEEIKFTYESNAVSIDELNQLSIKIFNNHHDKQKLKQLSSIQGKLERRLSALLDLKKHYEKNKALKTVIAVVEKEILKLQQLRDKIEDRLNSDDNLIAANVTALQVDNKTASSSRIDTSINNFRFSISSSLGVVFDKMPVAISAKIARIGVVDSDDDYYKNKDKNNYLAELTLDGKVIQSGTMDTNKESVALNISLQNVKATDNNIFELSFHRYEKGKKKNKIGSLAYKLRVLPDGVVPVWLAESLPTQEDHFVKEFPPVSLMASDAFGRLNPSTLSAKIKAHTIAGQDAVIDIASALTATASNDGSDYKWAGSLGSFVEGEYVLNATVADISGNVTSPYSSRVVVDRTAPKIAFGHEEGYEAPTANFNLNVYLTDASPVDSKVFLNGIEVAYSSLSAFQTSVQLKPGLNEIKVTALDKAGNSASAISKVSYDTTPPILTFNYPDNGRKFYTNKLPLSVSVSVISNEPLSGAIINNITVNILSGAESFTGEALISEAGVKSVVVRGRDLAGNETVISRPIEVIFDNTAPSISLSYTGETITNKPSVPVTITVGDSSTVWSKVIVNDTVIFETSNRSFVFPFELNVEGTNRLKVTSTDAAGNSSTSGVLEIKRDTIAPKLTVITPQDGSLIDRAKIEMSGTSDESLKSITVNGVKLSLSSDGTIFSGYYVLSNQGNQSFTWIAKDYAGNESRIVTSSSISIKLLIAELVTVVADPDSVHMWVVGAASSTRPGAKVEVASSFFNGQEGESNPDGSFHLKLKSFETAKLKVTDLQNGQKEELTVSFANTTSLAGVVKDIYGNPLVNAKVSFVSNNSKISYTDDAGRFVFLSPPTGDQTVRVDGSTVLQSSNGPKRIFSTTMLALNIGLGQNNSLKVPIYLTPLILDGTETTVVASSETVISSSHAPGVSLKIPAGSAKFPGGVSTGTINMITIPAGRATMPVPSGFKPTNVISLEPSGTTFTKKVAVTLPNDNELPPGTHMVFVSMNSTKGVWEVDGVGKVSSDGTSVVSNPDSGITHFSSIYAVPLAPLIASMQKPDLYGIDASTGGLERAVTLPSFKVYGREIKPTIKYKSTWANPTAFVSNIFAVPKPFDPQSGSGSGFESRKGGFRTTICYDVIPGVWEECYKTWIYWLVQNSYHLDWQSSNLWAPDTISSQFFVSKVASDQVTFTNNELDDEIKQISGKEITNAVATEILKQTGLPTSSVISFAVELKDPETGEYLTSGIHPSLARFQVKLKNLTITTNTPTRERWEWVDESLVKHESETTTITNVDQQLVSMLPDDIQADILVQNKTKSSIGRGWHLTGASRIFNPSNSRLMVEENDGSVSTYAVNNVITTLFDANGTNADLKNAVDLSSWPKALFGRHDSSSKKSYLSEVNLSSVNSVVRDLSVLPTSSGKLTSQGWYSCKQTLVCGSGGCSTVYSGKFSPTRYSFNTKFNIGGIIRASNGEVFLSQSNEHLFYRNTGNTLLLGTYQPVSNVTLENVLWNGQVEYGYFNRPPETVQDYCQSRFGFSCGNPEPQTAQYDCNFYAAPFMNLDPGVGKVGNPYPSLDGLNNPGTVIASPSGKVIIADTGNNRVLSFDPSTQKVSILVGDQKNIDAGDGGLATQASIFHPKGLAYDEIGNLYVSSENGLIRKVDATGKISTFAGGQVVSDQAPANAIMLKNPQGLAYDSSSKFLYVADTGNHRVLQINIITGIANKVAGNGQCSQSDGDNGPALFASICSPTNVGIDEIGNLVVVDSGHNTIRRISFTKPTSGVLAFVPSNGDLSQLIKRQDGSWERIYRNGTKEEFDSNGYQRREIDRGNRVVSYDYDEDGNLTEINFPNQSKLQMNYISGKLRSVVDVAGRSTILSYDGDLLTTVSLPTGANRVFEYDTKGQMISDTDGRGFKTQFTYNQWNRLQKISRPDGTESSLNDIESQTIANAYANGVTGHSKSISFADEGDENGVSTRVTDGNNIVTEVMLDHFGLGYKFKDGLGRVTKVVRNPDGRVVELIQADGSKKQMSYDSATGDLISIKDVNTNTVIQKKFDVYGNVVQEIDGSGRITQNIFDVNTGYLIESISPAGIKNQYVYNSLGLVSKQTRTQGLTSNSMIFEYDSKGNISKTTDGSGKITTFSYDLAGNVLSNTSYVNGAPKVTVYEYDEDNRLIKTISAGGQVTSYKYLATGELVEIIDANGNKSTFSYDSLGRLLSKTNSLGFINSFAYDGEGRRIQELDANGNLKKYTYDSIGQLRKIELPDNLITYQYDSNGNVTYADDNFSIISNLYDSQQRLVARNTDAKYVTNSRSYSFSYDYNPDGTLKEVSSGYGKNTYSYDSGGRLTQISNNWGDVFSISYDEIGRWSRIDRPGGHSDFDYNASGFLKSIMHVGTGVVRELSEYEYDDRNYIISNRVVGGKYTYLYDSNGNLVNVNSSVPGVPSETFSYDNIGNRNSETSGNVYAYDSAKRRLQFDGVYDYQYDNNGNVLTKIPRDSAKESFKFTYNSVNQLTKVEVFRTPLDTFAIREIKYTYDVLGRRFRKVVSNRANLLDRTTNYDRRYIYNGDHIFAEENANFELLARYTNNPTNLDDMLAVQITPAGVSAGLASSSKTYYMLRDHIGTLMGVVDNGGALLQSYRYKSFGDGMIIINQFGTDISSNPPLKTSHLFTGRELDKEAGLYYYRARYYDMSTGRFLQEDPHPGSIDSPITVVNKYSYAGNNPVMFNDPSGRIFGWDDFFYILASAFIATAYQNAFEGGNFFEQWGNNFVNAFFTYCIFGIGSGGQQIGTTVDTNWQAAWAGIQSGLSQATVKGLGRVAEHNGWARHEGVEWSLKLGGGIFAINKEENKDLTWNESIGNLITGGTSNGISHDPWRDYKIAIEHFFTEQLPNFPRRAWEEWSREKYDWEER
ncbi:RHS repeat-associated core domain-containing protein [Bdellovibrio sp. HCB-162]|uniref:RHS repeat-associated core domain-containing protein n=1 Tax=Bdellovibrio sp. HCB-162 TaxID=3394234 RepID=UPI0039BD5FF1